MNETTKMDYDAGKGRFLVLDADGKKLMQTNCWHIARRHTGLVDGASCWRLSVFGRGAPVQVLP